MKVFPEMLHYLGKKVVKNTNDQDFNALTINAAAREEAP
jgi:hypothetical protein